MESVFAIKKFPLLVKFLAIILASYSENRKNNSSVNRTALFVGCSKDSSSKQNPTQNVGNVTQKISVDYTNPWGVAAPTASINIDYLGVGNANLDIATGS
jgi:hypothetical protein